MAGVDVEVDVVVWVDVVVDVVVWVKQFKFVSGCLNTFMINCFRHVSL